MIVRVELSTISGEDVSCSVVFALWLVCLCSVLCSPCY